MRQHHADFAPVFQVKIGDPAEKQGGYVLVGRVLAAGPNAVGLLAQFPQFLADDVRAVAVGQPGRVADDGIDLLLGDNRRAHHIPQVVSPDMIAVGGVQFPHLRGGFPQGIPLRTGGYLVAVEHPLRVGLAVEGLGQVQHQQVELIRLAGQGHGYLKLDRAGFPRQTLGGLQGNVAVAVQVVVVIAQLQGIPQIDGRGDVRRRPIRGPGGADNLVAVQNPGGFG